MIDCQYRVTSERLLVSTNSQDGDKYYVCLLAGSQSHPVYVSQDERSIRSELCVKSLIFKVTFDAVNQSDIHTDWWSASTSSPSVHALKSRHQTLHFKTRILFVAAVEVRAVSLALLINAKCLFFPHPASETLYKASFSHFYSLTADQITLLMDLPKKSSYNLMEVHSFETESEIGLFSFVCRQTAGNRHTALLKWYLKVILYNRVWRS